MRRSVESRKSDFCSAAELQSLALPRLFSLASSLAAEVDIDREIQTLTQLQHTHGNVIQLVQRKIHPDYISAVALVVVVILREKILTQFIFRLFYLFKFFFRLT